MKTVRSDRQNDSAAQAHFLREINTAGMFDHPNLVRAQDAWEEAGCLYLVLEFLEGVSLQGLFDGGEVKSVSEVLDVALGMFSGT